jgi:hypothetical protein
MNARWPKDPWLVKVLLFLMRATGARVRRVKRK